MRSIIDSEKDRWTDIKLPKVFFIILLVLYAAFHIYVIQYHEAWRDEAQAWTIAKNTSLREMFSLLSVEGHPALWFLFLRFFAKLGLSYPYISYLSLALMTAALALLFFKSPFPDVVKFLLSLGAVFFYFYSVVSRVYAMVVLIVILLAVYWPQKYEKPILYGILIALLFQTHIVMSGMAIGLMLCMLIRCTKKEWRTKRQITGTAIAFLSLCLLILELLPAKDAPASISVSVKDVLSQLNIQSLYTSLCVIYSLIFHSFFESVPLQLKMALLLAVITAVLAIIVIKKQFPHLSEALFVWICGLGAVIIIVGFIYSGTREMHFLCHLISLFAAWAIYTDANDRTVKTVVACLACVLSLMTTNMWIDMEVFDIRNAYSGAKSISIMIRDELPENSVILVNDEPFNVSALAYTEAYRDDIRLYNVDTDAPFSCYTWKRDHPPKTAEDIEQLVGEVFPEQKNIFLLLSDGDSSGDIADSYEMTAETPPGSLADENFRLFKIR
ncbi:MAG: hypothetical protein Q4E35_03655 [Eubacteriales bacterium]|nr:hypothetical protein [Eubacteriales bacterium]